MNYTTAPEDNDFRKAMHKSLKLQAISGIGYNTLAKIIIFILSTVSSVILARNLTAGDYGIIGFGMIFINFLMQFSDLGISSAVIQKHELNDDALYTGFTLKCILGVAAFSLAFFLSPLSRYFFDNPAISDVIKILSLNFILSSFAFIPTCLLTRNLDYKKMVIPQAVSSAMYHMLAILLAINGFKYWSIVIANICSVIVNIIALNTVRPTKIRFTIDQKVAVELLRFGGNLFLSGVVIFAIFNADNFIIGSVMGSAILGYYALAFNWGSIICTVVHDSVHSVLFPAFSKIQHDRDAIKKSYLRVLEYVSFVSVLVNSSLFIGSRDFLYYILGHGTDRWLPAIYAFQIMCVYGIIRSMTEPVGNVIMAAGKSSLLSRSTIIVGVIELSLLYPVLKYFNIEGVAVLVTVAYSFQYFIYYPFLKSDFNISLRQIFSSVMPSLLSVLFMVCAAVLYDYFISTTLITFILKMLMVGVVYVVSYGFITRWRMIKEIKEIMDMREVPKNQ
ncbi:MAG TPA: lipopolysaccharide biosynthesis protein [Spirochaetota bacterium]|nr:lipopolysaccharide biosynthesis protein [Spirochaetota bacterium]HRT77573.1 lipopolysaccharide biosynthesis protein [Spirochaetota bacterium]